MVKKMTNGKRKLIINTFITLDGVMQAPGGPDEDTSGEFTQGGWSVNFWDDMMGQVMGESMGKPFDLLLGRKTYEIFAAHWPFVKDDSGADVLNNAKKYAVSKTLDKVTWNNSELISKNVVKSIQKLKTLEGPEIQVHGSSNLIQTLLKHQLVDEFCLWVFPVALGRGKRFFEKDIIPLNFNLIDVKTSTTGVIIARYNQIQKFNATGSFELENGPEDYQKAQEARKKKNKEES